MSLVTGVASLAACRDAEAATVTIGASRDNSIFSDNTSNASGAGPHLYTGRSGGSGVRRGLIYFDVAGAVPSGASIDEVRLTLHLIEAANMGPPFAFVNLHRLTADWGEGASNGGEGGMSGNGAPAQTDDATWTDRFLNSMPATPWSTAGGDFIASPSADGRRVTNPTETIGQLDGDEANNFYFWETIGSGGMIDDVQLWLDNPAQNFGWLLMGDESQTRTTRRFHTREDDNLLFRPALQIQYSLNNAGGSAVPEPGSAALLLLSCLWFARCRRSRRDE